MVHLHIRSCYSLLQGSMTIDTIIRNALEKGVRALCLSDIHVMHGAMEFTNACRKHNIKPLYGMELHVLLEDDDSVEVNVIANDYDGYQELLVLSTMTSTTHQNGILLTELRSLTEHCTVILMLGGHYELSLIQMRLSEVEAILKTLSSSLSYFMVGLIHQESPLWASRNASLKEMCRSLSIGFVAMSRVLYENEGDEQLLAALSAMKQGVSLKSLHSVGEKGRYFRSKEQMEVIYEAEELVNAANLAAFCTVVFPKYTIDLPAFDCPQGVTSAFYLRQLCLKGLQKRRQGNVTQDYIQRLDYELGVIEQMSFENYFLVVWDYVRYAKSIGIQVGAGRGSAAGSLVAYVLGITHVDPLQYDLLFERFLNPERISMPDIDIDFPDHRRDEVIAYVKEKYGYEHTAHILTFNTLKARQVIRDVGRVLEVPAFDVDLIAKKIPAYSNITLQEAYNTVPALRQAVDAKAANKQLFQLARALEGLPRHSSTHAAGIVIARHPLVKHVPLMRLDDQTNATQYPMEYLEQLGLIKMDFLGLRNLTIIDTVLLDVEKTYGKKIDIMHLPMDDTKTLDLIRAVDTVGIFQLESDGMKSLLKKMEPVSFDDVVLTIALFRPGPMENIPEYLARRKRKEVVKIHPKLDSILQPTYGIMVYQEQIMQVAQIMAGFSLGRADLLRRAMSKKNEKELMALKEDFVVGAKQQGFDETFILEMFELIMKFANYGFNKSHSVAYGMISYQMAYLKANYALSFFRALLNSVIGSENKTYEYMEEAKRIGIKIFPPCVNKSIHEYSIEQNCLRFPLQVMKSVGVNAVQEVIREREDNGLYADYFDFVARVNSRKVNRKVLEALIDGGALDGFALTRNTMLQHLEDALKFADLIKIEDATQTRLNFNLVSKPALRHVQDNLDVRCQREKDVLGFYLSTHPIVLLKEKKGMTNHIGQIKATKGSVKLIAQVNRIKTHRTKTGEMMAFVSVVDEVDTIDIVLMPKLFAQHSKLAKGDYVYVSGRIDDRESILVQQMATFIKEE